MEVTYIWSGSVHVLSWNVAGAPKAFVRMLEEEAVKSDKPITVYLPVRLATYLLNEKRDLVQGIEERHKISIKIVVFRTDLHEILSEFHEKFHRISANF